ncbi:MAG: hypothetical protein ABR536_05215 [Solirubrobacterales bacterium]
MAAVGLLVLVVVFALGLFGRLGSGQDLIDNDASAFQKDRVNGARAGINIVSDIVDTSDPIVNESGGASNEVPKLVAYVSTASGLPPAQVLAALEQNAPKTTALLQSLPLSDVSKELPGLLNFLATTLKLPPKELGAALQQNFPGLAQTIANLPKVTDGWDNVPGTANFTNFDGKPVKTVPDVRDYFSKDLVPVLETQQGNFSDLDSKGGIGFIPALLTVLGAIVLIFGLVMMRAASSGSLTAGLAGPAWWVVAVVGLLVIVLVFGLKLFPRLSGGDDLLSGADPAYSQERVDGSVAGINIVSNIVDMADPIATDSGTAAPELPKLVAFVSEKTGLAQPAVLAALTKQAPKTSKLLAAIPLSDVSKELPGLLKFLATTLKVTPDELNKAVEGSFPALGKTIAALPKVTSGWDNVPGTEGFTNFAGDPVKTVPDVRDYFAKDAIPNVLTDNVSNFDDLDSPWPPVNVFPPLLLIIGLIVLVYGIFMALAVRRA